jgi:hypothetical protein
MKRSTKPKGTLLQMAALRKVFNRFDTDGSGSIDAAELTVAMQLLGETPSSDTVRKLIAAVDTDGSGEVDFEEFVVMMRTYQTQGIKKDFDLEDQKKLNLENALNAFKTFQVEGSTSAYKEDGNPEMDSGKMKRRRHKLRRNDRVAWFLDHCWEKLTRKKGCDAIPKVDYIKYMVNVCKVIWDEEDFSDEKARAAAEEDWNREMGPHALLWFDKELFCDSLFELVDIWAASTRIEEYLYYLQVIVDRVFYNGKKWPEHLRGQLRATEHVLSVQAHAQEMDDDGTAFSAIWFDKPQQISVVVGSSAGEMSSLEASDLELDSLKQNTTLTQIDAAAAAVLNAEMKQETNPPWFRIERRSGMAKKNPIFNQMKLKAPRTWFPTVGDFTWQLPTPPPTPPERSLARIKTSPVKRSTTSKQQQQQQQQQQQHGPGHGTGPRPAFDPKLDRHFVPQNRGLRSVVTGSQAPLAPRGGKGAVGCGGAAFAGVAGFAQSYTAYYDCSSGRADDGEGLLKHGDATAAAFRPDVQDRSAAASSGREKKINVAIPLAGGAPTKQKQEQPTRPRRPLHEPKHPKKQPKRSGPTEDNKLSLDAVLRAQGKKNARLATVTFQVAEHTRRAPRLEDAYVSPPPQLSAYELDVRTVGDDGSDCPHVARGSGAPSRSRLMPSPPKASKETSFALYSFRETGEGGAGNGNGGIGSSGITPTPGRTPGTPTLTTNHLQLILGA